jgi:hypothetical protein
MRREVIESFVPWKAHARLRELHAALALRRRGNALKEMAILPEVSLPALFTSLAVLLFK